MQITMFDKQDVIAKTFEESHVLHKANRMILVARLYVDREETRSPIVIVREADLSLANQKIYEQVKADYNKIRAFAETADTIHTTSGDLIEIRTKGAKNSSSYAFYARKKFVNLLLGLTEED